MNPSQSHSAAIKSLKCDQGWERVGETCYYFSTYKLNWNASRNDCRWRGGDLVKIESREEQIFLDKKLEEKMTGYEYKFWIGLTDSEKEGEWLWVDGSPLNESLVFWNGKEPDNWTGKNPLGENCARMGERGGAEDNKSWFDRSCEDPHKHICEKSAINE